MRCAKLQSSLLAESASFAWQSSLRLVLENATSRAVASSLLSGRDSNCAVSIFFTSELSSLSSCDVSPSSGGIETMVHRRQVRIGKQSEAQEKHGWWMWHEKLAVILYTRYAAFYACQMRSNVTIIRPDFKPFWACCALHRSCLGAETAKIGQSSVPIPQMSWYCNPLILKSPQLLHLKPKKIALGPIFPGFGAAQAPGATGAWQLKLADKGPPTSNVNTPRPIAEGVKMGQDSSPTLRCPVFGYKNGKATRKKMKSVFSEDTNGI